jgi:hypothetical protein
MGRIGKVDSKLSIFSSFAGILRRGCCLDWGKEIAKSIGIYDYDKAGEEI